MADHAEGIAVLTLRTADEPHLKPLVDIPRMADIARELLVEALESYTEMDAERARQIARRDDEVDRLYEQVYRELLTFMISDPRTITRAPTCSGRPTTSNASPTASPTSASAPSSS